VKNKISASEQFSKNPERYRDDKVFSEGKDLLEMTQAVTLGPKLIRCRCRSGSYRDCFRKYSRSMRWD
jgi:hypothetical protein